MTTFDDTTASYETSAVTASSYVFANIKHDGKKYLDLDMSVYKNDCLLFTEETGKKTRSKPKLKLKSKLGQIIFNDLFKELSMSPSHIGLFSGEGSELFDEAIKISHYYDLRATSPDDGNIALQHFDVCIIDDVIDRMESTMQRGNVIKEALKSLHEDHKELSQAYLVIFSKKMNKEELESIALFAGVRKIIDTKCLEALEHTCIVTI